MIKKIEILLENHNNFVLYRLPNKRQIKLIISNINSVLSSSSFTDFNVSCKGFLFAPYNFSNHPSLLLQPDYVMDFDFPTDNSGIISENTPSSIPNFDYQKAFEASMAKLNSDEQLEKLVLARSKSIPTNGKTPLEIFFRACSLYPNAMVYWINTSLAGSWLGATPELFLSGSCDNLKTVALAGSQSFLIKDPCDLSMWDCKNRMEQNLVEEYLKNCIQSKGKLIDIIGPFSFQAGHIAHLKSELRFAIEENKLMDFIAYTHPTPAICGLPQSLAKDFLNSHESFDRLYFSGLLGWLEPQKSSDLFVNLRCLNWLPDNSAMLYAGSGLLSSSNLLSEWSETESKMQTIKQLFE